MSYYDGYVRLSKKTRTGIKVKGWFWQDGFPDDQPDIYEKSFPVGSISEAENKLVEYAEKEKADPELEDQPKLDKGNQIGLFS